MMASFSEGLVLGKKVGLDPATIVEVVGQGAIAAPMFAMKGPSMVKGSYPPAFPLKHQQKVRNSSPSPHKAETVVTEGEDSTDGLFPCEEFSGYCCGLGPCLVNFSITVSSQGTLRPWETGY
jgi:hypothetical protein